MLANEEKFTDDDRQHEPHRGLHEEEVSAYLWYINLGVVGAGPSRARGSKGVRPRAFFAPSNPRGSRDTGVEMFALSCPAS